MHVGKFAHDSLGHAIEHGQIIGSHVAFNVQCQSNEGACGMLE